MNRVLKICIFTFFILTMFFSVTSAQTGIVDSLEFQGNETMLSLDKASEIVINNNAEIKQMQIDLEEASMNFERALKSLEAYKDIPDADRENSMLNLQKRLNELNTYYSYESAKRAYDGLAARLKADVERAYFTVLHAEASSNISYENMQLSNELYNKVKKKYELGLVSKQDVLNAELNCINAQTAYKASQTALKKAKMSFNMSLNLNIMDNVKLTDKLEYREFELGSIAEAIEEAFKNRDEVYSAEHVYNVEQINTAMIQKQYPEYTYQYKEQALNSRRALENLENAKKAVELDVRNKYLDVAAKQDEITSGKKAVELAEEALRLSQITYDAGMGVQDDVQRAQIALQKEKLNLSQAILDYNLAVSAFKNSIGTGRK